MYNKHLFLIAFLLMPFIAFETVNPLIEDLPIGLLVFVVMFLPLQNWITFKNKENRDYQHARLPLPNLHVAAARMVLVILIGFLITVIYFCMQWIIKPRGPISYQPGLVPFGLVIAFFSMYFYFRDLLLHLMRNNRFFRFTKERSVAVLISFFLILNLLGVYFFLSASNEQLNFIGGIFRFFAYHPLVTTPSGNMIWMVSSLILASLTLLTFRIRKSYLE
jgi:hypothetical protein